MAKVRDKVWYVDKDGKKWSAHVTKAQTLVDGLPAPDSYDVDTVDISLHSEHTDEAGITHSMIVGGVTAAKMAKTSADQKSPNHWWPKS